MSLLPPSFFLMVTLAFQKNIGQLLARKSGIKVPFLPSGPFFPFKTTVFCSADWSCRVWIPLQILYSSTVITVWPSFLKIWSSPNSHYFQQGAATPHPASLNSKKCVKWQFLSTYGCYTRLDGQHCPSRTEHGIFSRADKPFEDKTPTFLWIWKG